MPFVIAPKDVQFSHNEGGLNDAEISRSYNSILLCVQCAFLGVMNERFSQNARSRESQKKIFLFLRSVIGTISVSFLCLLDRASS